MHNDVHPLAGQLRSIGAEGVEPEPPRWIAPRENVVVDYHASLRPRELQEPEAVDTGLEGGFQYRVDRNVWTIAYVVAHVSISSVHAKEERCNYGLEPARFAPIATAQPVHGLSPETQAHAARDPQGSRGGTCVERMAGIPPDLRNDRRWDLELTWDESNGRR